MVALTARGHVRIKSPLLYGFCGRRAVIAAVIGGRNLLCGARGVFRSRDAGLLQLRRGQLRHGHGLLLVVGLSGDVTRSDDLVRLSTLA